MWRSQLILVLLLSPLYSPQAGFDSARHGEPLVVSAPYSWPLRTNALLREWNHHAGWGLFVRGPRSDADIKVGDPDRYDYPNGTYAVPINAGGEYSKTDPYAECLIMTDLHTSEMDVEHELGHCLGFKHRRYGIMSQDSRWIHSDDRMIQRGGY